jgi:hypothetical protein
MQRNIVRKLFVVLLSFLSLSLSASLITPQSLGDIAVANCPNGFVVIKDEKIYHLGPEAVDSSIRKMDFKQRSMYIMKGGSLALSQTTEGNYILRIAPKIKGGGLVGASIGAKIGYFAVHFVSHTTIGIISACTGPFALATAASLEATAMPWILIAAKGGAIAGGVIGGVATGPV